MLNNLVRTPVRTLLPLLLLMSATAAHAQEQTAQGQQREHVVRRGDTLWDLARAYLQNPFLWRLIYEANRDVVANPHWIYPAERLIIPPVLRSDAPDSPTRDAGDPMGVAVSEPEMEPELDEEPSMVVSTLDMRRPVVALAEYLAAPWVSTTAERQVTGRVLRLTDPAAATDRIASNIHPNERIYVGDLTGARPHRGDSMVVVRFGRRVGDWGRIVEPLAVLVVESVDPTVATARVVRQFGTARLGDAVMPLAPLPVIGQGDPEAVTGGVDGHLLQFLTTESLHGPTDLAFISVGGASGVGIGDEFTVYVPARTVSSQQDERLPAETVGTVRVVKVEDRTATVRVLSVNSAALQDGLPVRMTRKMP